MRTWFILMILYPGLQSCSRHDTEQASVPVTTKTYWDPYALIQEGQTLLSEGDLVVRLNQDPISLFIKNFNRLDKTYSHAGIVLFDSGHPYIFHMVKGDENPDGKMRKDSLGGFCNPRKSTAFGIFRYKLKAHELVSLKRLIRKWYEKGVQFDTAFDLTTNDRMYCSEMVSKSLAAVTNKRIAIGTTRLSDDEARLFSSHIRIPFAYASKLSVVAIDDLYKNPFCHTIKEFNYKTGRQAATGVVANYQ
ncbi:MAG: hypothetical protein JNK14_21075 [Chitinophagaceae bacterium]|nr:hypothetical protein [Chitinophagaceae bacterium]